MTATYQPRIPVSFKNEAGSEAVDFGRAEYSFELEAGLHTPEASLSGGHGSLDLLADSVAVKQPTMLRLAYTALEDAPETVDASIDAILEKCFRFGRGQIVTEGRTSGGGTVTRWARARATAMPRLSWEAGMIFTKAVVLGFRCEPFWKASAVLDIDGEAGQEIVLNANPDTFSITNDGTAPVYDAIIELRGTYANPVIWNLTTGQRLAIVATGTSASTRVRFDAGRPAVEVSVDGGTTWTPAYASFQRNSGQVHLMRLDPGVNQFRVHGANGATFKLTAYAAYH